MVERFIVKRMMAPGVQLYLRESYPIPGELVYHGEFTERRETRGLNEPVTVDVCEPVGEVTSTIFEPQPK